MRNLNEVTSRIDNTTFNQVKRANYEWLLDSMTDEEKTGLNERIEQLEEIRENGDFDALAVKADGFSEDEYEEFNGMDLEDELMILRNFF